MDLGGVRLIAERRVGCGPGTSGAAPLDAQVGQQDGEHRGVVGLTRSGQDHQRSSATIDELMDLGQQSARRATHGVIGRLFVEPTEGSLNRLVTCRNLVVR